MATHLSLKVEYENDLRRIPATDVKKDRGRLIVYNGDKVVGEFPDSKVEYWSLDDGSEDKAANG